MTLMASVLCDGCGMFGDGGKRQAHVLRERLRRRGWRVGILGGADLCPDCQRRRTLVRSEAERRGWDPDVLFPRDGQNNA